MNNKNKILAFALSLAYSFNVSAELNIKGLTDVTFEFDNVSYVVGNAILFPTDTDILKIGFYEEDEFKDVSFLTGSSNIDYERMMVTVEPGGLLPLTKRNAGKIDIMNDEAFDLINEYYGKDVTYMCYGRRFAEDAEGTLQCAFFDGDKNIFSEIVSRGFAGYLGNVPFTWIDQDYDKGQKEARNRMRGIWSAGFRR